MICAVAFCPQAPVLVPALSRGAHPELSPVTDAVTRAITRAAQGADAVALLGAGPDSAYYPRHARGELAGFGESVPVRLGGAGPEGEQDEPVSLPVSLTVGAHLLHATAGLADVPAFGLSVGPDGWAGSTAAAAAVDLLGGDAPVALLVLGDGTARRTLKAPGYLDERSAPYDEAVSASLTGGDPAALRDLDPVLGAELLAAGVPAWRRAGELLAGSRWDAELLHESDPFGVDYLVALWTARA